MRKLEFNRPLGNAPLVESLDTLTVTQAVQQARSLLQNELPWSTQWIVGEISGFSATKAGHLYFTLKDGDAQLSAVCFAGVARQRLLFQPADGQQVRVRGRADIYMGSGRFQIIINQMELAGEGILYQRYLELKKRLQAEGLFERRKHPLSLPLIPKKIGVITSPTGAVIRDIIDTATRRWPAAQILLYPAQVQGSLAAEELRRGVEYFRQRSDIQAIIIGRGGGSIEDLWCFNDESLARALFASPIPIVAAIGHATDHTIADEVADYSAVTPTAAAERIWPDAQQYLDRLLNNSKTLHKTLQSYLQTQAQRVDSLDRFYTPAAFNQQIHPLKEKLNQQIQICERYHPEAFLQRHLRAFEKEMTLLQQTLSIKLADQQKRVEEMRLALLHLDPRAVLKRGYALVTHPCETAVTSVHQVNPQDQLQIELQDGKILVRVEEQQAFLPNVNQEEEA